MVNLQITDTLVLQEQEAAIADLLREAAQATLAHTASTPESDLTVMLGDDALLQELNFQYLGIAAPTDVLSFPAGEIDPDTGRVYLGDVVVSYPRAQLQSAGRHSLEEELQLLVVHGVLHLLGYDHGAAEDKSKMWAVQEQILKILGCMISPP